MALDGILLDLPFKGVRNYLHSTDIWVALVDAAHKQLGRCTALESLTLRKPFKHAIRVEGAETRFSSGAFVLRRDSQRIKGYLVESAIPVSRRLLPDSAPLREWATIGLNFGSVSEPVTGHRPIDVIVGLMKILANQLLQQHWWLSEIKIDDLQESYPIAVRIRLSVGTRCIIFDIVQDGKSIGSARLMSDRTSATTSAAGETIPV